LKALIERVMKETTELASTQGNLSLLQNQ